jgi:hypothetical protein
MMVVLIDSVTSFRACARASAGCANTASAVNGELATSGAVGFERLVAVVHKTASGHKVCAVNR